MNYLFFLLGERLFICKLHEGDFGQHADETLIQQLFVNPSARAWPQLLKEVEEGPLRMWESRRGEGLPG